MAVINATSSPEFSFPSDELKTTGDEKINLPSSVFVSETGEYILNVRTILQKIFNIS